MKKRSDEERRRGGEDPLRQKFREKADELFDRMMTTTRDGQDTFDLDFTAREALAEGLGKELASLLLTEHLADDRWRERVEEASFWRCPRCGEDAPRRRNEDGSDAYEEMELKTKVGTIRAALRQFCCGKCRKVFSPLPSED